MLRNLLHEIVRRRLWPIPVLAVLVAVAAPVLFLKSSPSGAPAADSAPLPATDVKLPARAERLLAATGSEGSSGGARGSQKDPFAPPASQIAAAKAAAAGPGSGSGSGAAKAPNTDTRKPASTSATGSKAIPVIVVTPKGTTSTPSGAPATTTTPATRPTVSTASVDVRFGAGAGGRVHRAIARLQTYFIHGKLAAVFVKYSPTRNKAVFALAPSVGVSGPVTCRRKDGVCRYLDIPAGSFARLTMLTPGRVLVRRRLDVVRIHSGAASTTSTAVAAAGSHSENTCLLGKLQALKVGAAPIARDACER